MSQRKHRSSLFLLELILVIFFFSLTSAVCIQLFVKAHLTERETEALNRAVPLAESAAEAFHSVSGNLEELKALFPEGRVNEGGDSFQVVYDEDWHPLDGGEGTYMLSVTAEAPGQTEAAGYSAEEGSSLKRAAVRVGSRDTVIYEITATVQIPRAVSGS